MEPRRCGGRASQAAYLLRIAALELEGGCPALSCAESPFLCIRVPPRAFSVLAVLHDVRRCAATCHFVPFPPRCALPCVHVRCPAFCRPARRERHASPCINMPFRHTCVFVHSPCTRMRFARCGRFNWWFEHGVLRRRCEHDCSLHQSIAMPLQVGLDIGYGQTKIAWPGEFNSEVHDG